MSRVLSQNAERSNGKDSKAVPSSADAVNQDLMEDIDLPDLNMSIKHEKNDINGLSTGDLKPIILLNDAVIEISDDDDEMVEGIELNSEGRNLNETAQRQQTNGTVCDDIMIDKPVTVEESEPQKPGPGYSKVLCRNCGIISWRYFNEEYISNLAYLKKIFENKNHSRLRRFIEQEKIFKSARIPMPPSSPPTNVSSTRRKWLKPKREPEPQPRNKDSDAEFGFADDEEEPALFEYGWHKKTRKHIRELNTNFF